MRVQREAVARAYGEALADVEELELPADDPDRIHSWHLYPIRLRLDRLAIDRNAFIDALKEAGVGCSVHWRPLHLHPYYQSTFGWRPEDLPVATRRLGAARQPADLPGDARGGGAARVDSVRSSVRRHLRAGRAVASAPLEGADGRRTLVQSDVRGNPATDRARGRRRGPGPLRARRGWSRV